MYIPFCIWEFHDYYIDKLSILREMALEWIFGWIIVKAAYEDLPSLRLFVTAAPAWASKILSLMS